MARKLLVSVLNKVVGAFLDVRVRLLADFPTRLLALLLLPIPVDVPAPAAAGKAEEDATTAVESTEVIGWGTDGGASKRLAQSLSDVVLPVMATLFDHLIVGL